MQLLLFQQHKLEDPSKLILDVQQFRASPLLLNYLSLIAITCPLRSTYKLPPGQLFYLLSACSVFVQNHLTCNTQTSEILLLIRQSHPQLNDSMHKSKPSITLRINAEATTVITYH